MQKDNTTVVLTQLVQELRIPVTRRSISDQLEKHPDYDSILAFSDVLDYFRVPNAAYRIKFDQLSGLALPFIAFVKKRQFAVVTDMADTYVTVSNEKWTNKKLPVEEFKKIYLGSVLVAEKDENSGEAGYAEKRRVQVIDDLRLPTLAVGSITVFLTFLLLHSSYIPSLNLPIALLTLFKTAGLITSILLLMQSIDVNNPLIQKLCGGDEGKDCNAILSSKAAKVNSFLTWSEVGFFYFAGTWLVLLFPDSYRDSSNLSILQILALLNVISLPYTFYSIYYQWRVAKQWCVFCCAVQALLWLEFFAFTPYLSRWLSGSGLQMPSLMEWSSLAMGLVIPVLTWMLVKPYLLQAKQIAPLKAQLRRFKYNKDLFNKALNDEVKYTLPSEEHSLIIGNREAEKVITMVSNPYCQPCAKAHKVLDEWLEHRPDIKLQVVFSTQNNEKDKKTEIAAHLMGLQSSRNDASLKKALNDWYGQKQKSYEAWAKLYPLKNGTAVKDLLEAQKEWCKLTEIKGTPTLFFNGRRLPKTYQTEDLKYFI